MSRQAKLSQAQIIAALTARMEAAREAWEHAVEEFGRDSKRTRGLAYAFGAWQQAVHVAEGGTTQ